MRHKSGAKGEQHVLCKHVLCLKCGEHKSVHNNGGCRNKQKNKKNKKNKVAMFNTAAWFMPISFQNQQSSTQNICTH